MKLLVPPVRFFAVSDYMICEPHFRFLSPSIHKGLKGEMFERSILSPGIEGLSCQRTLLQTRLE